MQSKTQLIIFFFMTKKIDFCQWTRPFLLLAVWCVEVEGGEVEGISLLVF